MGTRETGREGGVPPTTTSAGEAHAGQPPLMMDPTAHGLPAHHATSINLRLGCRDSAAPPCDCAVLVPLKVGNWRGSGGQSSVFLLDDTGRLIVCRVGQFTLTFHCVAVICPVTPENATQQQTGGQGWLGCRQASSAAQPWPDPCRHTHTHTPCLLTVQGQHLCPANDGRDGLRIHGSQLEVQLPVMAPAFAVADPGIIAPWTLDGAVVGGLT